MSTGRAGLQTPQTKAWAEQVRKLCELEHGSWNVMVGVRFLERDDLGPGLGPGPGTCSWNVTVCVRVWVRVLERAQGHIHPHLQEFTD